jgi:hypothetical protein
VLAPYHNDISQSLIFTSSVFEIFIFQTAYSFAISWINVILVVKNDWRYYLSSKAIGGKEEFNESQI